MFYFVVYGVVLGMWLVVVGLDCCVCICLYVNVWLCRFVLIGVGIDVVLCSCLLNLFFYLICYLFI